MNFMGIGTLEILFIIVIALLILGPNRMIETARTLGKYIREFQRAASDVPRLLSLDEEPPPALPPRQSVAREEADQRDGEEQTPPSET